jgi:hypothetical protein
MKSTTTTQLRLMLLTALLLGGFLPPFHNSQPVGISRALAQQSELPDATTQQGEANKEDKEDKENENDKQDVDEDDEDDVTQSQTPPPTLATTPAPTQAVVTPQVTPQPTPNPTPSPTQAPIPAPTPNNPLEETALPQIMIDLKTASGTEMGTCYSFLHDFVENLLTSSRVIPLSSFNSTSLDISIQSLGDGDVITTEFSKAADDGESTTTNVRIHVNGMVYYYPMANAADDSNNTLKDSMSHGMTVYLTLWGPGDLEEELEKCGISNPTVTAIHVDEMAVVMPVQDEDNANGAEPEEVLAEINDADVAVMTSTKWFVSTCIFGGTVVFLFLL